MAYGEGVADRIRAAAPGAAVDAFLDAFGGDYVELALNDLKVAPATDPQRRTLRRRGEIRDQGRGQRRRRVSAATLEELARLIAAKEDRGLGRRLGGQVGPGTQAARCRRSPHRTPIRSVRWSVSTQKQ